MQKPYPYKQILVESFEANLSGHRGAIEVRPLPAQEFSPNMLLECSRRMVDVSTYPLGTVFKVWVRVKQKQGGRPHLYCNHRDPIEVVERKSLVVPAQDAAGNSTANQKGSSLRSLRAQLPVGEVAQETDESAFPEGAELFRQHRRLERDRTLTRRAKAKRLQDTGKLECEICSFDFARIWGEIGAGFIEAHHKTPVHELDGIARTKISDLALVCSNCHRMLHRFRPQLDVDEMRAVLAAHFGEKDS
jgi:hypothetical protein